MDRRPPHSTEPAGDDQKLLLAARDGDHDAGRRMIARHGPSMQRTAWRVLGRFGGNDADDVVQEALISALTTPALPSSRNMNLGCLPAIASSSKRYGFAVINSA